MWQNKPIPLVGGQNDSIGQGQAPVIHRLINGRVGKQGEVECRRGFDADITTVYDDISNYSGTLPAPTNLVAGQAQPWKHRALIVDSERRNSEAEDEVHLLTDGHLLSKTNGGWVPRDLVSAGGYGFLYPTASGVGITEAAVGLSDKTHTQHTVYSTEEYTIVAWLETVIRYTVYDNATGNIILDSKAHTEGCTFMMAVGNNTTDVGIAYIINNNLKWIDLRVPTAPVLTTLKTTAFNTAGVAPLYVARSSAADKFVCAYYDTVAGLTAFLCTWAGAVSSTTSYATAGAPDCCCIEWDATSSRYVIAAGLGTGANNILTKVLNSTLVDQALNLSFTSSDSARRPIRMTVGFTPYFHGALALDQPTCFLAWQLLRTGTDVDKVDMVHRYTTSAVGAFSVGTYRYATLLTTMFDYNRQLYVGLGHRSALQGTMYFVNMGIFNTGDRQLAIAGRTGYTLAKGDGTDYAPPVPIAPFAERNGKAVTAHLFKTKYDTDTTDIYNYEKTRLVYLDFAAPVSYEKVNGALHIACGSILKEAGGAGVNEVGILQSPEMLASMCTFTGAAGSLSAGSYSYRVYYESNYKGRRVRSYAFGFTVTAAANDRAEILVPSLQWTQRADVAIVVYRTTVNPTAATPYYRVTAYTPSASGTNGWYNNVFNADTVLVRDGLADASITDEETDYLYQTEVGHVVPDRLSCIASYADRVVAANESTIYPSIYFTERTGVEFSVELGVTLPDAGGKIVGISQVGNSLVVFKSNKIYAIAGQGPDNTLSTGLGFSEPYAVSQDIGAVSASAIKRVPGGVAFASRDGFYLLNESMQLQFLGKDISNVYKAEGSPTVLNIAYDPVDTAVVFFTASYIFVYYMLQGAWSVWTYEFSIQCGSYYNGGVALADGYIVCYQTGQYGDDTYDDALNENVAFNWILETDYINIVDGDQGGSGRVFSVILSGRWHSGATYSVGAAYDQSNEYETVTGGTMEGTETYTVPSSPANTVAPYDRGRFEHMFAEQRCSSVRIRVTKTEAVKGVGFTQLILRHKNKQKGAAMSPNRTT